ncbi:MAG: ribosomal protein [Candidatus Levybacteria bacterium]|nr:ribosomal protein [Candidatus Levybacteria bacterium]
MIKSEFAESATRKYSSAKFTMNNLQVRFKKEIAGALQKELSLKNVMAVPALSKIVVNMGVKDAIADKKNIEKAAVILSQVTGQKPKWASAKKSISAFKLREGDKIGLVVTLRGRKMYDFLERLISVVLPRFRDFHGVRKTSFDGNGNYTLGFTESTVFPEIDPGKIDKIQGFEITIVTTANDDKSGLALLKGFGMPFVK